MKKKIAIIDDNTDVLASIKYGIEEETNEFEMYDFEFPEAFLDISKEEKFDLIILDIMMPKINGWDLFAMLKKSDNKNKDTPIMFLTAKNDEQSIKLGSVTSAEYITKPFEISYLLEKIREHVNNDN